MASMHSYMKVGLIQFMAWPQLGSGEGAILETLRRVVCDDFFDAVEITRMADPGVRAAAREMLAASQMTVAYGAHPILLGGKLNLNAISESEREMAVDAMKAAIDEAYELGAHAFAFLSGRYETSRQDEALAQLVKSTIALSDHARRQGEMPVVLEIFDYDVEKCSLIGPAPLAARFADTVRDTGHSVGLLADLSHIPLIHETLEEALLPVREHLVHAHMGNCVLDPALPGYGDQHPRFGCPGGVNNVAELAAFLRLLHRIGFLVPERRPVVSFEVKPLPGEEAELVIANAKRTLHAAWATLDIELANATLAPSENGSRA